MTVALRQPLSLSECQQIRIWRNAPDVFPMLRSGYLSEAEQATFYATHIAPQVWHWRYWTPEHRYYAIDDAGKLAGVCGLTYLWDEPGQAEISLVLGPHARGRGVGSKAVDLVLAEAWRLGLREVIGECYGTSPARWFWQKQTHREKAHAKIKYAGPSADGRLLWAWVPA